MDQSYRIPGSRGVAARAFRILATLAVVSGCSGPADLETETGAVLFFENGADAVAALGETLQLSVSIRNPLPTPVRRDVSWSTSNSSVLDVSADGVVTIREAGVALVTASYLNYQAHTTVHAAMASVAAVASVTVTPSTATLSVGDELALEAEVRQGDGSTMADAAVTWISSDEAVAVVEAGALTAVAPGRATITAASGGKSGKATVTVSGADEESDSEGSGGGGGEPRDRFRAFPEAEGYGAGALTTCDRSRVQVLRVTNTAGSGSGSLADALSRVDPSRLTVVTFRVAGTIPPPPPIRGSCLYVAGQTAPGDGIQLHRAGVSVLAIDRSGPTDVVVRYIRARSGKGEAGAQDAANLTGGRRVVLDHLSVAFGNDEVFSVTPVPTGNGGSAATETTIQWTIIAAGLVPHSTGSLVSVPSNDPTQQVDRITLTRNLWAHNSHRNPRLQGSKRIQIVNNVVYNWRGNVGGLERGPTVDIIGNYFKAGPWTFAHKRQDRFFHEAGEAPSRAYVSGNVADPVQMNPGASQRTFIKYPAGGPPVEASIFVSEPFGRPSVPVTVLGARQAYDEVLKRVGSSARVDCSGTWLPARDGLDERIVSHVRNGSGPATNAQNDHPDDYQGIPSPRSGQACPDGDGDGMPDAFETRYGLDLGANDVSRDPDGDGYTNIEEYVNGTAPR